MQPPQWVLDKIEELHPLCRLGYDGGDEYAVCELWRVREAPTTMIGAPFLGHVYGSRYDPLEKVPLQIMTAGFVEVQTGAVIDRVKAALTSFKDRAIAMRRAKGEEEEAFVQEMAEELGDRFWHEGRRSHERGVAVADKHIMAEEKAIADGTWSSKHDWSNKYVDRMPQNGVPIK